MHDSCPSPSELADLIAGRLSDPRHELLERHVAGCQTCQQQVEALDEPQDTLVASLHSSAGNPPVSDETQFHDAVARLKSGANKRDRSVPPAFAPLPSSTLGDFHLLREIGRGGMGIVYEAEQISLGRRRVALKVLPFAPLLDSHRLERFQNEARAAASLRHSHIVAVYAVGVERGVHYFAMQLVEGRNLAEVIRDLRAQISQKSNGSMPSQEPSLQLGLVNRDDLVPSGTTVNFPAGSPPTTHFQEGHHPRAAEEVRTGSGGAISTVGDNWDLTSFVTIAKLGIQAADALNYAHENGIVHRDIKPSNLLLDDRGDLWVSDFGVAQIASDQQVTATGDVVGTLRYLSPEQASGRRGVVDHRSDIYGLGVTLYELATLSPCFSGKNPPEILQKVLSEDPVPPRTLNPRIPVDLETIILKATAKDAADRYATARELEEDLSRFVENRQILAGRPTAFDLTLKWILRNKQLSLFGLALLSFVVVAAVSLTAVFSYQNARLTRALNERNKSYQLAEKARGQAESSATKAQNAEYAMTMGRAFEALAERDTAQVRFLLERLVPDAGKTDFRGFEWQFLYESIARGAAVESVSEKPLYCVAVSPDSRWLAAAGQDATITMMTTDALDQHIRIETGQGEVNGLAFSPDGKLLASTGDDGTVRFWDVASGSELRKIVTGADIALQVLFTPDGRLLASTGHEPVIRLWNTDSGTPAGTLDAQAGSAGAIAISPDGRWLASGSRDRTIAVWDLTNQTRVRTLETRESRPTALAFSTDGTSLVSGHTHGEVYVWSLSCGRRHALGRHWDPIQAVSFLPDGSQIVTSDRGGRIQSWPYDHRWLMPRSAADGLLQIECWSIEEHGRIRWENLTPNGLSTVAVMQDRLLTRDLMTGHVQIQEVSDPGTRAALEEFSGSQCAAFSPTGNLLLLLDEVYARSQNPDSYVLRNRLALDPATISSLVCLPDGRTVAVGTRDGAVTRYDMDSGLALEPVLRATSESLTADTPAIDTMAVSTDGTQLAFATAGGGIEILELATGKRIASCEGHRDGTLAMDFSLDGARLATVGHGDPVARIWDTRTGAALGALPPHSDNRPLTAIAFSHDSRFLATVTGSDGNERGSARLWDVMGNSEFLSLSNGGNALAFSTDRMQIATIEIHSKSGKIRAWDLSYIAPDQTDLTIAAAAGISAEQSSSAADGAAWHGHLGGAYELAFLADTGRLVSVGGDGCLRIWNLNEPPAQQILEDWPESPQAVWGIACSKQAPIWACVGKNGLRIYRTDTQQPVPDWTLSELDFRSVDVSPAGDRIAAGCFDGNVRIWDHKTRELLTICELEHDVWNVHFSPSGEMVAAVTKGSENIVRLFDTRTGARIEVPTIWSADDICFSPDGTLLAITTSNRVVIWELADRIRQLQVLEAHSNGVEDIAFSHDSQTLASGGGDRRIILWDRQTWEPARILRGHKGAVSSLAFSPDGKSLVSAGEEDGLKVWHLATGLKICDLLDGPIRNLAFTADGTQLLCNPFERQVVRLQWGHRASWMEMRGDSP